MFPVFAANQIGAIMVKCIIGVEQAPRIQFTIDADPDNMPQLIVMANGDKLTLTGKCASPGQTYSYMRVDHTYHHHGEVKEWVQYSKMVG